MTKTVEKVNINLIITKGVLIIIKSSKTQTSGGDVASFSGVEDALSNNGI